MGSNSMSDEFSDEIAAAAREATRDTPRMTPAQVEAAELERMRAARDWSDKPSISKAELMSVMMGIQSTLRSHATASLVRFVILVVLLIGAIAMLWFTRVQ